jgi:acyl-coenzyme A thioesterase PaaI-like protein
VIRTHQRIAPHLCGTARSVEPGRAVVELVAGADFVADDEGLVHGGFVFGLADYAAMLAINEPTVVLGAAEARFLAPARVGDVLVATASAEPPDGKKRPVRAVVEVLGKPVFEAIFTCFVPARHVLHGRGQGS